MFNQLIKSLFKHRSKSLSDQCLDSGPIYDKILAGFDTLHNGNYTTALDLAQEILRDTPHQLDALLLQGISLTGLGEHEKAIPVLRELVTYLPENAGAWKALGEAAEKAGQTKLMVECYQESLEINPAQLELEAKLGNLHFKQRHYTEARHHYEKAIALGYIGGLYLNLAATLGAMGRSDLAFQVLQHAVKKDPDLLNAWRGLLGQMLFIARRPSDIDRDIFSAFSACAHRLVKDPPFSNNGVHLPHGRIRVGYLTADFCGHHPIPRNMLPILSRHNRLQFEIFAYADIDHPDETTTKCQKHCDNWRDIKNLSDREVAKMIHADHIDILVILAARFDENRPQIFVHRPAPIQVSFHDAATSGLPETDYIITDIIMTPRDTQEWFSERVVRLPTFYLHEPMEDAPEIAPLPAKKTGHITFGSYNNPSKLNPEVFALWSRVLKAVPGSRLILKHTGRFGDPEVQKWCLTAFRSNGIEDNRIEFPDLLTDRANHLALYQQIDIALDPFPFTGSTTTFEALWMGVPIITLAGDLMVGRWSTSMLYRIGHPELIARSEDEYVAIASCLANDLDRLEALHLNLRDQVRHSPLCNAKQRTRQLERAYRYMFHHWKNTKSPDSLNEHSKTLLIPIDPDRDFLPVIAHLQAGHRGAAAALIEELLPRLSNLSTDQASALNEHAVQLILLDDMDLALRILGFVQECSPNIPSVLCNLGIAFAKLGRFDEAMTYFARGHEIAPEFTPLTFNYAIALCELEKYDESRQLLRGIVTENPTHIGAWAALSEVEHQTGNTTDAVACSQRGLDIAPEDAEILTALGNALREQGKLSTATTQFTHAIEIKSDYPEARLGLAFCYLLQGQFEEGWQAYEARRQATSTTERLIHNPEWKDESLSDKTILIYGEQGLGDDIMFASCYQEIIDQAKHVVIDCEPRLQQLFARSFPQSTVLGSPRYGIPSWINRAPSIDLQIPSGSLPHRLRNHWSDFPAHHGYLRPDAERVEAWQDKLQRLGPGLKIGMSWQGGIGKTRKATRSISLDQWKPILSQPGCQFISLQYGKVVRELDAMRQAGFDIVHWEDATIDYDETASLVTALDLVITVCTSLVHLTGALGKPAWVMTPPVPEWRYMITGEKMPWYPTVQLFRASSDNEWSEVIKTVKHQLTRQLDPNH